MHSGLARRVILIPVDALVSIVVERQVGDPRDEGPVAQLTDVARRRQLIALGDAARVRLAADEVFAVLQLEVLR